MDIWQRDELGIATVYITRYSILKSLNSAVPNDDKMTIVCEITMPDYEAKEIKLDEAEDEDEDVEEDVVTRLNVLDKYETLLEDSKFSDVALISAEGKTVKAHKCILAKDSSVFAAMFDVEMKEKQENTVKIDDMKHDVLVEMIRFIYAGKVNNIDTLVMNLAVAADKYALDELKVMCEKRIIENLSLDNVIDCLQLADRLLVEKLREKATEFIVENASDVTTIKPEFQLLSADNLRKVCCGLVEKIKQ